MADQVRVRTARAEDYDPIAAVLNDWWQRDILGFLPRTYLRLFHRTSLIAERDDRLAGFLVGILSPSAPQEAYVHFVGVAPDRRRTGLAADLYRRFFELAAADGRSVVSAVTSPVNVDSIAFHRRLGFTVTGPLPDYDGPGRPMVTFRRPLP